MKPLKIVGALVLAVGALVALVVGGRWLVTPPPQAPEVTQGEVAATQVDVAAKSRHAWRPWMSHWASAWRAARPC